MKLLTLILLFLTADILAAEGDFWGRATSDVTGDLRLAKKIKVIPAGLLKNYPQKKYNVYAIDLDSDGKEDFIVESKKEWETCFVSSDFTKSSCEKLNAAIADTRYYFFFSQLDSLPGLELFQMSIDEMDSEELLKTFHVKSWKFETLLAVQPVVDNKKTIKAALPWDITGMYIEKNAGDIRLQATFDQKNEPIQLDGYEQYKNVPAVMMTGAPTKGTRTEFKDLKGKMKWLTLKELIAESTARKKK